MRKSKLFPLANVLMVIVSASSLTLTGCDVEVSDEGPVEELVDGEGTEIEIGD